LISKSIGNLRDAFSGRAQKARGSTSKRTKYRKDQESRIKAGGKECQGG